MADATVNVNVMDLPELRRFIEEAGRRLDSLNYENADLRRQVASLTSERDSLQARMARLGYMP